MHHFPPPAGSMWLAEQAELRRLLFFALQQEGISFGNLALGAPQKPVMAKAGATYILLNPVQVEDDPETVEVLIHVRACTLEEGKLQTRREAYVRNVSAAAKLATNMLKAPGDYAQKLFSRELFEELRRVFVEGGIADVPKLACSLPESIFSLEVNGIRAFITLHTVESETTEILRASFVNRQGFLQEELYFASIEQAASRVAEYLLSPMAMAAE